MAMKASLKKAWIRALRSGEYEQGRDMLQMRDQSYCCLGVLCRVAEKTEGFKPAVDCTGRLLGTILSCSQRESFGLTEDARMALMGLNDQDRKTFPEIADWIQKNVKVLKPPAKKRGALKRKTPLKAGSGKKS